MFMVMTRLLLLLLVGGVMIDRYQGGCMCDRLLFDNAGLKVGGKT